MQRNLRDSALPLTHFFAARNETPENSKRKNELSSGVWLSQASFEVAQFYSSWMWLNRIDFSRQPFCHPSQCDTSPSQVMNVMSA